jgi:uncharacterized protein YqjF (DUF2071 family)
MTRPLNARFRSEILPEPSRPWEMAQTWERLLFVHWPVPQALVRSLLPDGLELDLFNGKAWIGVVPFRMSNIHLNGWPRIPGTHAFPEINVRTYVRVGGRPGVYFLSLDAQNYLAVVGARLLFHLPYHYAHFDISEDGQAISYDCRRRTSGQERLDFSAVYGPVAEAMAKKDALTLWLTERYCLYSVDGLGRIYRGEVRHKPWPLRTAKARLGANGMAALAGIRLPSSRPLLHYCEKLEVKVWGLDRL